MLSASCGVPVTVTASLRVTVMLRTSPAFNRLFWAPVADVMAMELTVGATSSRLLMASVTAFSLLLLAASVAMTVKL